MPPLATIHHPIKGFMDKSVKSNKPIFSTLYLLNSLNTKRSCKLFKPENVGIFEASYKVL